MPTRGGINLPRMRSDPVLARNAEVDFFGFGMQRVRYGDSRLTWFRTRVWQMYGRQVDSAVWGACDRRDGLGCKVALTRERTRFVAGLAFR
jgi:hypothetical protein